MIKKEAYKTIEGYDNTQSHIANIGGLGTIEEVESYDYKVGYPEKPRF